MTNTTVQSRTVLSQRFLQSALAWLICAGAFVSGCGVRKRPSIAWSTAVLVKPVVLPVSRQSEADPLEDAPDLKVELTLPPKLAAGRATPPRPRVNSQAAGVVDSSADVPLLAPQLSIEETSSAQRETNQSIGVAEKNLASTRGRSLNTTQADLASKVRGFIADAKDAARAGDWDSARSLAKKAQVLSQELASSL